MHVCYLALFHLTPIIFHITNKDRKDVLAVTPFNLGFIAYLSMISAKDKDHSNFPFLLCLVNKRLTPRMIHDALDSDPAFHVAIQH